jgi:hypothetical protein
MRPRQALIPENRLAILFPGRDFRLALHDKVLGFKVQHSNVGRRRIDKTTRKIVSLVEAST